MATALDPPWQDLDRAVGQMLIMGWDGTEITPQIRSLIVDHGLGSILLTAKNLKSAEQTALLVQELQTIAHQAGHPVPLLIALDQENGGVNSLFDEDYVCQFPSAMGIAATGRAELAYQVNKATATELGACGINLMLGPVLDVLSNARYQPLGVRAASDDPQEVSQYGIAAMDGIKDAGLASCGKHFPSYGNLDFLGSTLDMPIITQTLEELSLSALVPFRNSVATGKLDAMFVGGCGISNPSMNVNHACLSDQVVDDLLRNELGFEGVAISECLEMEALSHDIGVANGVIMAVNAGCDLVLLCRAYSIQLEAVKALKLGYENGNFSKERIYTSLKRVLALKAKCTDWDRALNPPGISLLSKLHPSHLALSRKAYDESVTIIRDRDKLLPLTQSMLQDEDLLLLTPLVNPLPASALTKSRLQAKDAQNTAPTNHDRWVHRDRGAIMSGEGVFRELGRSLARGRHGKLLHTSYTPTSVRPLHENLINRASCIIIVTADANRNLYQTGFVKHVDMMCSMLRSRGQKKSLIVVAVSSPYDFAMDKQIGTYVCTFDFTETAMKALVRALLGEFKPQGTLPGTLRKSKKVLNRRQPWLVEEYDRERDANGLEELLKVVARSSTPEHHFLEDATAASFQLFSRSIQEAHYVVRNSSTHALYGFAATYFVGGTGILGAIFVDPTKRNVSIGRSLHRRAIRSLLKRPGCAKLQLGTGYPGIFLGLPSPLGASPDSGSELRRWFRASGWDTDFPRRLTNLVVHNVAGWSAPEGLLQSVQRANFRFDLVQGIESGPGVLGHIEANAGPDVVELYAFALQDPSCGVVRVKGPDDSLLGTVIECKQGGSLSTFIPSLREQSGGGGSDESPGAVSGIVAPVVAASAMASSQGTLILQGLALMGIRRHKTRKAAKTVLSWVLDDSYEHLMTMGFEVAQTFEQVTNSADNFSDMA